MATAEQLKALVESFSNSYADRFRAIVMQVAANAAKEGKVRLVADLRLRAHGLQPVHAKLRVIVKRITRKYGYPPDKQAVATNTGLPQAELLSDFWSKAA